jgi:diguanylate cyclase (GGDEF)-like protein
MVIDLDHFKNINDKYGHAAGDEALVIFAEISRTVLRNTDVLGRLGGEEFGFVLPDADLESALQIAERLRVTFAAHVFTFRGQNLRVTASIGVTELFPTEDSLEKTISRADQALYLAKDQGRNRTVAWDASMMKKRPESS